ncbi:unnamed protein product, partial [Mesorhabditis spiculigera]
MVSIGSLPTTKQRFQARYPVNTFKLVNEPGVDGPCERRQLWCNWAKTYVTDDDDVSLKKPSSVIMVRPRLQC